ncbi:MAG: DUF1565 domain-containing protein, partial [Candidatus Norongarragalinales archaeon]
MLTNKIQLLALLLVVLLASTLTVAAGEFPAHSAAFTTPTAADTVYCNSCVDCTQKASVPGARVVLTQNLTYGGQQVCVDVTADDVSFDCDGHEIRLSPDAGGVRIGYTRRVSRVSVSNCFVAGGLGGVLALNAEECVLTNNVVRGSDIGLTLQDSLRCTLRGNKVIHGESGDLFAAFYVNGFRGEKKYFEHDV